MSITMTDSAKRTVEVSKNFTIYQTQIGENQLYITARAHKTDDTISNLSSEIYNAVMAKTAKKDYEIIYERIFASLELAQEISNERAIVYKQNGISPNQPYTLIQGNPVHGRGMAGIQIRAFKPTNPDDFVETIFDRGTPVGRKWHRNGTSFIMLQNIYGDPQIRDRYHQACDMFDRAQHILQQQGLSFQNVLRTWIYLAHILDWYGEFNRARNARFAEFGLLGQSEKENREAEQIYLPASTGILGENPQGAAGTMDVFAVPHDQQGVTIAHTTGVEQKSPFRYGSAFSRAMTVKENDVTNILLSGTASIDEHGKTVFQDNSKEQIRKTLSVVQSLIREEGASLNDIVEATIFLKNPGDIKFYEHLRDDFNIDLPAVFLVADVCRDDLLFELDAAIAF